MVKYLIAVILHSAGKALPINLIVSIRDGVAVHLRSLRAYYSKERKRTSPDRPKK